MTDPLPRVRNTVARWVYSELRAAQADTANLLRQAGLSKPQIADEDGWLPYESHARFLDLAATELGDPYFGLNLAKRIGPREFGALAYVGLSSSTLGEALRNLERYQHVHSEAWLIELSVSAAVATLTCKPRVADFAHLVQATEAGVGMLVNAYRHFTGGRLTILEIGFIHSLMPKRKRSQLERLLNCPVTFSSNHIQISLEETALQLPIGSADDRLLHVLRTHCANVLREQRQQHADVSAAARNCISEGLSKGRAKARLVAGDLGMTERSLHRKLSEEKTSFGEILDKLRRSLAAQYLSESNLSTKQIAFLLGYADQSSFGVAHRRWTGLTPKAARVRTI
jgi:AraC-like DNA-binding protein